LSVENPPGGFSTRKKKFCVRLKFSGISGRRTDTRDYLNDQCAHWSFKYVPGAQVAGNEWKVRRGLPIV